MQDELRSSLVSTVGMSRRGFLAERRERRYGGFAKRRKGSRGNVRLFGALALER